MNNDVEIPLLKLPSVFIVGTMKGGTTILYESLCTHPQIAAGTQKEIHYFSLYPDQNIDWYASHFKGTSDKLCIDASPSYFDFSQSTQTASLIKKAAPNAKVILIVRDPIARAVSHFYHMKKVVKADWLNGIEINDFFSLPFELACRQTTALEWLLNQVLWYSCYSRKFSSYKSVFNDLLVLTNDQLRNSPIETMRTAFEFLDLEYSYSDFFGQFKYSTGSSVNYLEDRNYAKLKELLIPDFEQFCQLANVECDTEKEH